MKIGVIGSNSITDKKRVFDILESELFKKENIFDSITILGQGGKGVANFTKEFAKEFSLDFVEFLPYHLIDNRVDFSSKYFFIRNRQIIDNSDLVIAIWNGDCKDVEYGIKYSQKKNLPISVVKIPKSS